MSIFRFFYSHDVFCSHTVYVLYAPSAPVSDVNPGADTGFFLTTAKYGRNNHLRPKRQWRNSSWKGTSQTPTLSDSKPETLRHLFRRYLYWGILNQNKQTNKHTFFSRR